MMSDRRYFGRRRAGVLAAVAALAAAAVAGASAAGATGKHEPETRQAQEAGVTAPSAALPSLAPLAERLSPTVVSVTVVQRVRLAEGIGDLPLPFRFFFQGPFGRFGPEDRMPEFENRGSGSGVVVDPDGYVVTNAHVVSHAAEVTVQTAAGESYPAEVVGVDEPTDLALLRIRPHDPLPAATFGDSDTVDVGDWVVAIGNPFGLEHTVTLGIVSAKERRVTGGSAADRYGGFIQTDASINPGNSGGPLFNLAGEVVGINTAINAAGQGIGFAIPSNVARMVIGQLRDRGRVERSWIGVTIQTVTPELAESFGLIGRARGALVADVTEGAPADRAGIRPGDVILRFGDHEIGDAAELPWLASIAGVGSRARLQIWRDGAKRDVVVTLDAMPDTDAARSSREPARGSETARPGGLGLRVRNVPAEVRRRLGVAEGGAMVEQVDPSGPAANHGIRPGDVIIEVDGSAVGDADEFAELVRDRTKAEIVRLRVRTAQGTRYVGLRIR